MRFTPAGAPRDSARTVTVAIRVDAEEARAISVRSAIAAAKERPARGPSLATLAPARFNLGVSRGYQSFAKPAAPALSTSSKIEMLDLASYRPHGGVKDDPEPPPAADLALEAGTRPAAARARSRARASRRSISAAATA